MDPVSVATSLVMNSAAAQADLVAIKLIRQNADSSKQVLQLLDAADRSMDGVKAAVGPGLGGSLDITV